MITYADYYKLLDLAFPSKIEPVELLGQDPLRSQFSSKKYDREYTRYDKVNVFLDDYLSGLPDAPDLHRVREASLIGLPERIRKGLHNQFWYLKISKIIVFYLRNRINDGGLRNYRHNINWDRFLTNGNYLVFINDTDESLRLYEDSHTVYNTKNLYEDMYFFGICDSFVSCDSGIIDFAKNCGCQMVRILPTNIRIHPANFKPFGSCKTIEIESNFLLSDR